MGVIVAELLVFVWWLTMRIFVRYNNDRIKKG